MTVPMGRLSMLRRWVLGAWVGASVGACSGEAPARDEDHDGVPSTRDCDDTRSDVFPGAPELCDGVDQDCDGATDEDATDARDFFRDVDGDTWGDAAGVVHACQAPAGSVARGGDCEDQDAQRHPELDELCDGVDQDCDGATDEDVPGVVWYADVDGDGYGAEVLADHGCLQPAHAAAQGGDCNDGKTSIHPGALETRGDGIDQDCNGFDACETLVVAPGDLDLTPESPELGGFCEHYNAIAANLVASNFDDASLEKLSCLCEVGGDLTVEHVHSDALRGLRLLRKVGQSLKVSGYVSSVAGLGALTEVGANFSLELSEQEGALDSLAGLEALTSVGGTLEITAGTVPDYAGLAGLTSVGLDLRLHRGRSYVGLETLTSVGRNVVLAENRATSLEGLEGLSYIPGFLIIDDTAALEALAGLENVTSIGGPLIISNAPLTSLAALEGLESIGGDLQLQHVPALTSLGALSALTSIGGSLILADVPKVANFVGLEALTEIGGNLVDGDAGQLAQPGGLTSLDGLEHLATIGGNLVLNWERSKLEDVDGLVALASVGGDLVVKPSPTGGSGPAPFAFPALASVGGDLVMSGWATEDARGAAFPKLVNVGGAVELEALRVADLAWFPLLEMIGGRLWLAHGTLETMAGMDQLAHLGGDAIVFDHPDLEDISALEGVSFGGAVKLSQLPQVTRVEGLALGAVVKGDLEFDGLGVADFQGLVVVAVEGSLTLSGNALLTRVDALDGIATIGGDLVVQRNPLLTKAAIDAWVAAIGAANVHGAITIEDNHP